MLMWRVQIIFWLQKVITARDIPSGGQNIGSHFSMLGEETVFSNQVATFAGQNIGVMMFDEASRNCDKRIKVLMLAIFISHERFCCASKSCELLLYKPTS